MKFFLLPLTFALSLLAGCAQHIASTAVAQPDNPLPAVALEELSASGDASLDITTVEEGQPETQASEIPMNAWQTIAGAHGFSQKINNLEIENIVTGITADNATLTDWVLELNFIWPTSLRSLKKTIFHWNWHYSLL